MEIEKYGGYLQKSPTGLWVLSVTQRHSLANMGTPVVWRKSHD